MKVKVDKTVLASVALHVLVLGWAMLSISTKALEVVPEDSVGVDISLETTVAAGMKTGKKENPKPLADKVAEAKPVEDAVGKVTPKAPVVTDTSPPPEPKVEEKPVEKKPDPPKVAEKPKEEPKPEKKVDPIGDTIKKEEKKPPPKPVAQAVKPPEPAKPKTERIFDQSKTAALLNKLDPSRNAVTGDTLNSNAALGLAHGKSADNSATWGAMFKRQVRGCWKKPSAGIDSKEVIMEVEIKLKQDGTLQAMPVALTTPNDPFQRVFLESALRAIIECAPYKLPPAFFAEWKGFIPQFSTADRD